MIRPAAKTEIARDPTFPVMNNTGADAFPVTSRRNSAGPAVMVTRGFRDGAVLTTQVTSAIAVSKWSKPSAPAPPPSRQCTTALIPLARSGRRCSPMRPEHLGEHARTQPAQAHRGPQLLRARPGDQPRERVRVHPAQVQVRAEFGQPVQRGQRPDELVAIEPARVDKSPDQVDVEIRDARIGRVKPFEDIDHVGRPHPPEPRLGQVDPWHATSYRPVRPED